MLTNPINPRIRRWLETGHAVEALLGRAGYFVADDLYGDHDRILVSNQLLTWALAGHEEEAARALEATVARLLGEGDMQAACDVIHGYALVARSREQSLPLIPGLLESALARIRAGDSTYPTWFLDKVEATVRDIAEGGGRRPSEGGQPSGVE